MRKNFTSSCLSRASSLRGKDISRTSKIQEPFSNPSLSFSVHRRTFIDFPLWNLRSMHSVWFLFYNIIAVPVLWILFHTAAVFNHKVRVGLRGRRRLFESLESQVGALTGSRRVWFHSSSLGEFEQAK